MSDLIAAILGYLSSKYSQKKISKFTLSLIVGGLFFIGYFIVEILGQINRGGKASSIFMIDLGKDLILFSTSLFFLCYIFLLVAEEIEKWRKKDK